ncbi:head-tail connector protein [Mesorhizobium sp.]|uniref:head-tail connector protein n=1 Tax=Mesorhizobium sp. TaxID=1871066 RepID=UPI00121A18B0|nr:head-tail connector protein [Mesorhizobium sp.]TIO72236.1 MAG: phage head-tail connector protein [Mesorhizobium sp.]
MGITVITTVVTPPTSAALTTLANVKAELSITDASLDTLLTSYIGSASAAIAQYCNRTFGVQTLKDEAWPEREFYSYQLPGTLSAIQLSNWPVVAVTSLTENGDALVDGTDYRVDKATGTLLRLDGLGYVKPWLAWPIVATYSAGYATIPADIDDAAVRMVKARYLAKGRDPFMKQENIPGVREVTYWVATGADAGNMPPDVADILENYRQPVIA